MKVVPGQFVDASDHASTEISVEVCVIGAGPAGITLARSLARNRQVLVIESGGIDAHNYDTDLNEVEYATNFGYRINFKNRCRHLGGTANLWAGRLVPYWFDRQLDSEWGGLAELLPQYYSMAAETLGLPAELLAGYDADPDRLKAYWADRTERFDQHSRHLQHPQFSLLYNATFTGEFAAGSNGITAITCRSATGAAITVSAKRFVLACGGIETVRLLLLMRRAQPQMFASLPALGRYVMDHPKVTHGRVAIEHNAKSHLEYRTEYLPNAVKQTGRRATINDVRVYCNLVPEKRPTIERVYSKAAAVFMTLSRRYDGGSSDRSGQLIYVLEPHEILPRTLLQKLDWLQDRMVSGRGPQFRRIVTYLEMRPRHDNQVQLSVSKFDKFGNPLPCLKMAVHPEEVAAVIGFYTKLAADFTHGAAVEFDQSYLDNPQNYSDASHHLGGARFSVIDEAGVLNMDLSVKTITNCHILSTAAFPTGGVENPTFLLVAMAHYLAAQIDSAFARS